MDCNKKHLKKKECGVSDYNYMKFASFQINFVEMCP